ncbi:sugar transferase [Geotalea sp. SG265]|uniref:sugar transferase n=1 Tax=Geotalea sp. SG265 TaxID=2922867 RepID=UPI001FB00E1C|nr:sugar transferase [Geotalea sp. SG265]
MQLTSGVGFIDREYGIYSEEYFTEALCRERKRSERSNRPFVLMLVEFKDRLVTAGTGIAGKVVDIVSESVRETDVRGWVKRSSTIGVLITDIAMDAIAPVTKKIQAKVAEKLHKIPLKHISISFQIFPENNISEQGQPFSLLFYPDVLKSNDSRKGSAIIKRLIDIIGSVAGLILFSPLFAVISVAIKLNSKGPVIFRQERYGQYGKKITFLKFRSMYVNNDDAIHRQYVKRLIEEGDDRSNDSSGSQKFYKIKHDPRVTAVGRFLRKTSLDELPQFFNVLMGDISLVGPRPPIPYELENYALWHRHRILGIKPGLTGMWQVKGRSSTTFDGMVRLDLKYIREWSLWLDLKLMLLTPMAVVRGKGAC